MSGWRCAHLGDREPARGRRHNIEERTWESYYSEMLLSTLFWPWDLRVSLAISYVWIHVVKLEGTPYVLESLVTVHKPTVNLWAHGGALRWGAYESVGGGKRGCRNRPEPRRTGLDWQQWSRGPGQCHPPGCSSQDPQLHVSYGSVLREHSVQGALARSPLVPAPPLSREELVSL